MLFNSDSNWSSCALQNSTSFNQFQSRPNQQRLPSTTTTNFPKQSTDSRMPRRYSSSGTPTNQTGFIVQQPPMNSRRLNNKGTYRSATFHNPQQNPLQPQQFPLSNSPTNRSTQKSVGGQLRPSSSFHGCIQAQNPQNVMYSGRNSYNGTQLTTQQVPKQSIYAVSGQFNPGMKDVPVWLKGLRLHKYTRMFQEMSYEEMMALDDHRLEQRQVTKGARKKILQSLDKLRDRSQLIRQLEKCIDEHGDVRCLIVELRAMMSTPIAVYKPADIEPFTIDSIGVSESEIKDENLAPLITRLCIRLHEFLFRNGLPQIHELGIEDEYLLKLLQVYDKIYSNEAFTFRQRYFINECKRILARYMAEQKIGSQFGAQTVPTTQPTLVSSPSSGYHTMSPPSSSTRRNSDTKESVDDLTASATTASNSDDDGFHNLSSAPASPPSQILNFQQFQLNQVRQNVVDQWAQQLPQTQIHKQSSKNSQCPPPGFEWINGQNGRVTNPHFQPYVNDIGVIPQSKGWYSQQVPESNFGSTLENLSGGKHNQWADKQMSDSDSNMYNYLLQHLQQQQRQNPQTTIAPTIKPPKAPSPIGTRPNGYVQKADSTNNDPLLPLTMADKLRFLASDAYGSEILENVVQEAMDQLKLQKQRNESVGSQQSMLWQNLKEQPKPQSQQQSNWWNTQTIVPKQQKPVVYNERRPSGSNNFLPSSKPKIDYYDHWSNVSTTQNQDILSLSDQLTTSTSTLGSDASLFQSGSTSSSSTRLNYPSHNQQLTFDPLTSNDFQSNFQTSSTKIDSNRNQFNSQFDSNLLNRMLNDNSNNQLCGGQSQKQRIMQQYATPEDLNLSDRGLFAGITRADDYHRNQQEPLFAAFRPLACSASGAVH